MGAVKLVSADLGAVFGKRAQLDMWMAVKDGKTQVGELELAARVKEIRRLVDLELLQNVVGSVSLALGIGARDAVFIRHARRQLVATHERPGAIF